MFDNGSYHFSNCRSVLALTKEKSIGDVINKVIVYVE